MQSSQIVADFTAQIERLPKPDTPSIRKLRRGFSRRLIDESPGVVLAVAHELIGMLNRRWAAYEVVANHPGTYLGLNAAEIERLGEGINNWHAVDAFGRILSGPAWRDGLIDDETVIRWANSPDRWWRRTALVSTVALNMRTYGGSGDTGRTLAICDILKSDPDDMVVKAMSWALRELVVHDANAVAKFLSDNEDVLAARVKREVRNKLETGLKNPKRPPA